MNHSYSLPQNQSLEFMQNQQIPMMMMHPMLSQQVQAPMDVYNNSRVNSECPPMSVNYTDYNDLPSYSKEINLMEVLETVKQGFEAKHDWKEQFCAINLLRILNKYYPADVNEVFKAFWPYILQSLESVRSNISKNILIFLKEVFLNARQVVLFDEVILGLTPHLLMKCFSEKSFLKSEAQFAVEALSCHCLYDSTVLIFCKSCFDKNANICELSLKLLARVIENMCGNLVKLKDTTIQDLFITLGRTLDGKRGGMQSLAQKICVYLCNLLGYESYVNCLKMLFERNCISEAEAKNCMKALENKEKPRMSSIGDFKKQMKRQMSVMKMSYNDINMDNVEFGVPTDITNYALNSYSNTQPLDYYPTQISYQGNYNMGNNTNMCYNQGMYMGNQKCNVSNFKIWRVKACLNMLLIINLSVKSNFEEQTSTIKKIIFFYRQFSFIILLMITLRAMYPQF